MKIFLVIVTVLVILTKISLSDSVRLYSSVILIYLLTTRRVPDNGRPNDSSLLQAQEFTQSRYRLLFQ